MALLLSIKCTLARSRNAFGVEIFPFEAVLILCYPEMHKYHAYYTCVTSIWPQVMESILLDRNQSDLFYSF